MAVQLRVGQRVRLPNGSLASVRFLGATDFKEGEWLGLELDEPAGKNNGSVGGVSYFQCAEKYGMFMRPLPSIEVLEQPKPAPRPVPTATSQVSKTSFPAGQTAAARSRQSVVGSPSKRASIAPSNGAARRSTIAPQPTAAIRASRLSTVGRSTSPKKPTTSAPVAAGRPSLSAPRPGIRSPNLALSPSPGIGRVLSPGSSSGDAHSRAPRPSLAAATQPTKSSAQQTKAVEELQTKVQFLEKKRKEDRDKIRELDALKEKKTHYENVIQKLQSKCQSLLQENGELKKDMKDIDERLGELEGIQAEHDSIMELATLDREMAEERAESHKTELDALKGHMEELELENEILREENEELATEMSPDERASQGWMQLQRENDRLRQAVLKLRDWSQEQEAQLRDELKNLEEDSKELTDLRERFDGSKARILEADAELEDLREQLDAALGAEAMIEQLTDKNLSLSEQIDDLRKSVEHFQDLKELNDELEVNHVEHEKQLQEVIDFKESLLSDMNRQATKQEEELTDKEYTILRFRDLVSALQSDLENMRSSKEISELEAQNLENSSRAIMDLNRQLQASANSATVKAIDMELGKLEAQQASEHLSIVQLFLPDAFHSERDSVLALLRFKRIGFKAYMLHGFIKQRIGGPNSPSHVGVDLYAACNALDKLTWVWAMCDRFVASMQTSPLEQFSRYENTLHELEPVERSLNGYIDNLRQDDLQEQHVVDGLQRYGFPSNCIFRILTYCSLGLLLS
jgi:dynactin 1